MADIIRTIQLKEDLVIPPIPLPDALTTFTATPFSATIIDLGWVDPGLLAADYELQYSTSAIFATSTQVILPSAPGAGGVYSVTGLITATLYYFRIRARNASGNSAWATASATTL